MHIDSNLQWPSRHTILCYEITTLACIVTYDHFEDLLYGIHLLPNSSRSYKWATGRQISRICPSSSLKYKKQKQVKARWLHQSLYDNRVLKKLFWSYFVHHCLFQAFFTSITCTPLLVSSISSSIFCTPLLVYLLTQVVHRDKNVIMPPFWTLIPSSLSTLLKW